MDLFIQGRHRAAKEEYRRVATLAYWMLSAWTKKPPTPDKLMGEKSVAKSSDPRQIISDMKAKTRQAEKEIVLSLEESVQLDLVGEVNVDGWYWGGDSELADDDDER